MVAWNMKKRRIIKSIVHSQSSYLPPILFSAANHNWPRLSKSHQFTAINQQPQEFKITTMLIKLNYCKQKQSLLSLWALFLFWNKLYRHCFCFEFDFKGIVIVLNSWCCWCVAVNLIWIVIVKERFIWKRASQRWLW